MARVDFYILPKGSQVEHFACSVTAKAWHKGNRVHIHTGDEQTAAAIDDLLWTFRDISFVPHERYPGPTDDATRVTIGHGQDYPESADVIVNLDQRIPDFCSRFERVIEIVGGTDENKQLARQRYRQYRDDNFDIHDHRIESTD